MKHLCTVILLAAVSFLVLVVVQPVEFHLSNLTFVDDGFYYLGYARNIALGNGPTFDGLIETNGVQPLWSLLLIAVAHLVSDPEGLMRASMLLAIALVVISALAMNDILKQLFSPQLRTPVMLFYTALIATPQLILTGMETAANLALLTLALAIVLRVNTVAFKPTFIAGLFVAFACLARVDNLIIVPAFALTVLWRNDALQMDDNRKWHLFRSLVWFIIPVIVVFSSYLIFNLALFGRPLPVSGEIKSTLQGHTASLMGGRFSPAYLVDTTRSALEQYSTILNTYLTTVLISFSPATLIARGVLVVGMLFLVILLIRRKSRNRPSNKSKFTWLLAVSISAFVLFHTWMLFFQLGHNASALNWYYVPEYVFITLASGFLLNSVGQLLNSQRPYNMVAVWLTISMVASAVIFILQFQHPIGVQPLLTHYRMTQWANEHLPHDDIIGSFNAGVVGYFSDAAVINLDGLMNDDGILNVARGNSDLEHYIRQHAITWVMDYAPAYWTLEDGGNFQGIPNRLLEPIYSQSFDNYSFESSIFYVFRVITER